jgi:PIN domain nuclease of toxin-antitoxin system
VKFLLDTHVVLWWLAGDRRLAREQKRALQRCDSRGEAVGIAAITAWEIAVLGISGRLVAAPRELFQAIRELNWMNWLPLSAEVALEMMRLPARFHRDPADQLIAATARVHDLVLLTADERIRDSGAVRVL